MKVYVSANTQLTTKKITECLTRIGVDYTSDMKDVTSNTVFYNQELAELVSNYDDPLMISKYRGSSVLYVADRNNIKFDIMLNTKLSEYLDAAGLPAIPTIYPKTIEEVQAFFDIHGSVFCKPILGEHTLAKIFDNNWMSVKFDSFQDFIDKIDIIAFLSIQNSDTSLYSELCVLQKNTSMEDKFRVYGCVNGTNNYDFLSIMCKDNIDSPPHNRDSLWPHNRLLPLERLIPVMRDPTRNNVDKFDILKSIKALFDVADIKNVFIDCEGVLIDNIPHIFDVSIKCSPSVYNHRVDIFDEHMKFVLGMVPSITKYETRYSLYVNIAIPNGKSWNKEIVDFIKTLNVTPLRVNSNCNIGDFMIYGDTIEDLYANAQTLYEYINNQ